MKKKKIQENVSLIRMSNWYLYIRNRRIHLVGLLILLLVIRFIYGTTSKTIENYHLSKDGKICKAIVVSRMKVGGKGTIRNEYKFKVKNVEYEGVVNNEEHDLGDSIFVLYLKNNPKINRSYIFIKENYNTQITP